MSKLIASSVGYSVETEQRNLVPILENVNLSCQRGEMVGVLGPNGAGKSTLVKLLAGLIKPTSGIVRLDAQLVHDLALTERATQIAYLAQRIDVAWSLSVADVVSLGRLSTRYAQDDSVVRAAAKRTNIEHLLSRSVLSLSGGELMRVHIARLLATDAPVLLADEPIAGLDPYHQLEVMTQLHDQSRLEKTVVVVLHDLSIALRFCDRVLVLHEGRVAALGPPGQVLEPALLESVYRVEARQVELAQGGTAIVTLDRKL